MQQEKILAVGEKLKKKIVTHKTISLLAYLNNLPWQLLKYFLK